MSKTGTYRLLVDEHFEKIKERITILDKMDQYGIPYRRSGRGYRSNSPFRSESNSDAFLISEDGKSWKDKNAKGFNREWGDIFDWVAAKEHNGNKSDAAQDLANELNIGAILDLSKVKTVYFDMRAAKEKEGYEFIKEYKYLDKNGKHIHSVERLHLSEEEKALNELRVPEEQKKNKSFLQKRANGFYSVRDVQTILYNLNLWHDKDNICLTEGERDADTLTDMGFNATTNPAGAETWDDHYTELLTGKNIIIFEDNDPAGYSRIDNLLWKLKDHVCDIKIIRFRNYPEKFDVTDYVNTGKNKEDIESLISKAEIFDKDSLTKVDEFEHLKNIARKANTYKFANYNIIANPEKPEKKMFVARKMSDMADDIQKRFRGFPKLVGDTLFDFDFKLNKVEYKESEAKIFQWISKKSKNIVSWRTGFDYALRSQFIEELKDTAKMNGFHYDTISKVPEYPLRDRTFYSYPFICNLKPSENHEAFYKFLSFFNPATEMDKIFLASFIAAPMFSLNESKKPMWIIKSRGSGSGKTTLVEKVAKLHGTDPFHVEKKDLSYNYQEMLKRLISVSGREKKIFFLDNICGKFTSPTLAKLVTLESISGRPAYGRGEETRQNNLTYVMTSNSAMLDEDITERAYFITLENIPKTKHKDTCFMDKYINEKGLTILADVIDILKNHVPFKSSIGYRFPKFEEMMLQPFCKTEYNYKKAILHLKKEKEELNIEKEWCNEVELFVEEKLRNSGLNPVREKTVFIKSTVFNSWVKEIIKDEIGESPTAKFTTMSAGGHTEIFDGSLKRFPNSKKYKEKHPHRYYGILWNPKKYPVQEMVDAGLWGDELVNYIVIKIGHNDFIVDIENETKKSI